jgi:putative transcriptional regulator
MVLYDKLWNTMKTKGITQYRLINYYGISSGQLCRLRNNEYVSTHTLEVLCTILNCPVEDVMEILPDASLAPIINGKMRQR